MISITTSVQELYRPVVSDPEAPLDFTKEKYERSDEEDLWKVDWWTEQLRRIKRGYMAPNGVWINPFYYFFLNFCKADIFNHETELSDIGLPYYYDFQHELADMLWFCKYEVIELNKKLNLTKTEKQRERIIKDAVNIILAKARRKGLTTLVCAYIVWLFLYGDSVFGGVLRIGYGYPDDDTYIKFRAMFDMMLTELPDMLKANKLAPDNETEIGNSHITDEGEEKTTNRVYWANFGKKDGKFRGGKLFFAFFDEAGKFTNWKKVKSASKDCFQIGERRIGYYLLGGTSDAISNKGYVDYKADYDHPERSDAIKHFITAEVGMHPHIEYHSGLSLREAAGNFFKRKRAELEETGDTESLNLYKQENPIYEEELFILGGGTTFDNDAINEQIIWNNQSGKSKDMVVGEIEFIKDYKGNDTQNVTFVEKKNGNWMIYRNCLPTPDNPILSNNFFGAIDDVYQNVAPSSDSKPAMMIYKDWDLNEEESDLPVAIYLNKEKNRKKRHEDFLKGSLLFNAKVLYENNDDAYVKYMEAKGMLEFIQKTTNDKFGYSGHSWHGKFKSQAEELGIKYIEQKRHQRCYFDSALQALKDWGIKNTDIGVCYLACLLYQNMRKTLAEVDKLSKREVMRVINISSIPKPQSIPRVFQRYTRAR